MGSGFGNMGHLELLWWDRYAYVKCYVEPLPLQMFASMNIPYWLYISVIAQTLRSKVIKLSKKKYLELGDVCVYI